MNRLLRDWRGRAPRRGRLVATGLTLAAVTLGLAASAAASTPANLTGEFLSHLPPADLTSGTCNPSGNSTFTYTVTGTATGPYPGTFTEAGTVTIGPQTEEFVPGQFRGDLTAFSATVTITSAAGTVTATKTLTAGFNKGVCITAAAQIIASSLTYAATITTPTGTLSDQGTAGSNFNAYFVNPGANSSSLQFRGVFTSTAPPPADGEPPVVTGVPDRSPNGADWYNADVTVDWQSVDPDPSSGIPTDPADTLAATEGSSVEYTSGQSCDPAGNCATGSISLSIDKTDPTVGTPTLSVNPLGAGGSAALSATADDSLSGAVAGEYFLDSDPGEGNGMSMSFAGGSLSATIGGLLESGVYNACVRALDAADNWSAPSCTYLVVYDPSAGFATGGGWFVPGGNTSDPGDLLPGLDGTSKANFGFVVKYQNGSSTVPGGNFEFHYNVGKFHLRSTEMDWLVVTNSNWAKFQGLARIDGATGDYPFRVDARDDTVDRFVIKIWAPGANPDTDAPIYKASGDVEGGQVKIHRS